MNGFTITPKSVAKAPCRTLIYGEPGVGKTTFAAGAPDTVFMCLEEGANNIAVSRLQTSSGNPKSFQEVLDLLVAVGDSLGSASVTPFKNLAIDTLDALENLIHAHVCRMGGKKSMADFGYGKGFDQAVDCFRLFLSKVERLRDHGVGIILISHMKVETFQNPEGADFNYYDLKLHKKVSGLFVEWCDNVLFARREVLSHKGDDGKARGVGDGSRFLETEKAPTYVAKNRYDLPKRLPISWNDYEKSMANHQPARAESLKLEAEALVKQLPESVQTDAAKALEHIKDSAELAKFVDYCRSKVSIEGGKS